MNSTDTPLQGQIDTLMAQFFSPDHVRAREGIEHLRELPRSETWDSLRCRLLATNPDTRSTGALAMMLIDANRAIPETESLLWDQDVNVRLFICNLFGDYGDARLTSAMSRLAMNDVNSDVRYSACFFLEKHGDERALPNLRTVAKSDTGTDYEGNLIKEIAERALASIQERAKPGKSG
jgi:HEAT repeat protein